MEIEIKEEIIKTIIKEAKKDKYPEMTKEIVNKLWNDNKYSEEGLWHIAIALIKKLYQG